METILVTGGTGLIGRALTEMLVRKGYDVIILTRKIPTAAPTPHISYATWDVHKQTIDETAITRADHIIHLAGAGVVEKKWTAAYKEEILKSRTDSSTLLINTIKKTGHRIKSIISASAIGWYGEDSKPGQAFTETDPADSSFLGEACRLWEESIRAAEALNIRVCCLRTGIVLSNDGGALQEFQKPVKMGLAAILGSGKQYISWIHIEDLCRQYIFALETPSMQGVYNAVAPQPVTNKELTLSLAAKLKGKFFVPVHVPAFVLRLMMGSRSIEILKSTTVSATKIRNAGFTFLYPSIDAALDQLSTVKS